MKITSRSIFAGLVVLSSLLFGQAFAAGSISPNDLASQISAGKAPLIIDVRSEDEYLAGHVPGARLIPHTQMADYVEGLAAQKDDTIVLYCRSGKRAGMAAEVLEKAGFKGITILDGSFEGWQAAGKTVAK